MSWSDIQDEWLRRRFEEFGIKDSADMTQIMHKNGTYCLEYGCRGECLSVDELFKLYSTLPSYYKSIKTFEYWMHEIGLPAKYIEVAKRVLIQESIDKEAYDHSMKTILMKPADLMVYKELLMNFKILRQQYEGVVRMINDAAHFAEEDYSPLRIHNE